MPRENWQQIKKIFAAAVRQTPEARVEFLESACSGDRETRSEIESLLSSFDGAAAFLESPAVADLSGPFPHGAERERTGELFGHYEIVRRIGTGGMGKVYLAQDKKLGRNVAVKILNEQFQTHESNLQRFILEARSASALNHPNILIIHEIGETEGIPYIVSEFIEGKTLREVLSEKTLSLGEVLDISTQIASGLAFAHAGNIVHRDIKPENVVLRPDGFVKILDFGLAKLVERRDKAFVGIDGPTFQKFETGKGVILGTASYMSPEQARGAKVDERTDIFSLGTVMYEMVTGRKPFDGQSVTDTIADLLTTEPPPMARFANGVPNELQRIVTKCLKKDSEQRYQTVKDLKTDLDVLKNARLSEKLASAGEMTEEKTAELKHVDKTAEDPRNENASRRSPWRWLAGIAVLVVVSTVVVFTILKNNIAASKPKISAIAVLPLENLSGDPDQEYFADGMTEALISNLSRIHSLKVISRTSAMRYKGARMKLPDIARELNVDAIVEGTVQRAGSDVLITTQLVDPATDTALWSQNYKRQMSDVLKLQGDIAQAIVSEIRTNITAAERNKISGNMSIDPAAYDAYLQGRYHMRSLNEEGLRQATEYFQKAIAVDPNYAQAYAGLSDAYVWRGIWGKLSFVEVEQPARQAALKAVELDPESAEGLQALSTIKYNYDWDWQGAEADAVHALALEPNSVDALRTYGYLLMALGRHDESISQFEKAAQLDPVSSNSQSDLGRAYYRARRFEEAIPHFQKAAELDPSNNSVGGRLVDTYIEMRRYDDAMAVVSNAPESTADARKIQIYALTGRRDLALKAIEENKVRDFEKLAIYTALGDNDNAFKILQQRVDEKKTLMIFLMVEPHLERLHSDPRWAPLMKQMNFPGY